MTIHKLFRLFASAFAVAMMVVSLFAAPVLAEQGDNDAPDTPSNNTLTPDLLWQLADNAWNTHHYDDAVATMKVYATSAPDGPQCLEALWRASEAYRWIIPNKDKYQTLYTLLDENCNRWINEYKESDKERAASGMWYQAFAFRNAGHTEQSEARLHDLIKRFPTTHFGTAPTGNRMTSSIRPRSTTTRAMSRSPASASKLATPSIASQPATSS